MSTKPDDLQAVRTIVDTLHEFEPSEQERIIRWAREKLGLPGGSAAATTQTSHGLALPQPPGSTPPHPQVGANDLRGFVAEKSPSTDGQFVAAVAYYYRFEAPENERKDSIGPDDLVEACRIANRTRLTNPGQTLRNAHRDGLVDRADRGTFRINAVGENLVAMTLPGAGVGPRLPQPKASKPRRKKSRKSRRA